MNWFDTSGLAELAKNALKGAQKTIDKALNINEDEAFNSPVTTNQMHKCNTEPALLVQSWNTTNTTVLGHSLPGSFIEDKMDAVFTPTKGKLDISSFNDEDKRQLFPNSDSIEILSSPVTPASEITSPSITFYNSESVEVINTSTSNDALSSCTATSPDSIEYISKNETSDDEIISCNVAVNDQNSLQISIANPSNMSSSSPAFQTITLPSATSCESIETLIDVTNKANNVNSCPNPSEDSLLNMNAALVDSTQSFEDIQIIGNSFSEEKDLVKINSGTTSELTSADEIETTTSSDIEIISNLNGDSSSTNSVCRNTPLKTSTSNKKNTQFNLKSPFKKGHYREASEISIQSDDSQLSNNSEYEKLLRRISELTEILETKEVRFIEMEKQNIDLLEKNAELQTQLDTYQSKNDRMESEQYTQRLSALEKKFQMSIREKDTLRNQLKIAQNELKLKIRKDDLDKIIAEKDLMIEELQLEGEKLSKQILQHSNIIKKLRTNERETTSILKNNEKQISELTEEVERLKKSLTAKEEVERLQIEAVHMLSSEKSKLEQENRVMKSQLEDFRLNIESLKINLEILKKESNEKHNVRQEFEKQTKTLCGLETEKEQLKMENEKILMELNDLREKLQHVQKESLLREQQLRQNNTSLLTRLEAAKLHSEELVQETSVVTTPFVKQINALQTMINSKTIAWEKQEKELTSKLRETEKKLETLQKIEVAAKEKEVLLNQQITNLEGRLSDTLLALEQANSALQQVKLDWSLKESDYHRRIAELQNELSESVKKCDQLQLKCLEFEKNYELENDAQLEGSITLQEEQSVVDIIDDNITPQNLQRNNYTALIRRSSIAEDSTSSAGQMDDLGCTSNISKNSSNNYHISSIYNPYSNFYQFGDQSTTAFDCIQSSSLKGRIDSECSQLHWELSKSQIERDALKEEISNLTLQVENFKEKLLMYESTELEFTELQKKYDALLQMYGEKVEQAQELELDLQDVKEMYKSQINELLRQKNQS